MKNITEASLSVNITLMSILNLYSPDKLTFSFKVKTYIIFLVLVAPIIFLGVLNLFIEENFTNSQFNENVFFIAEAVCQVVKCLPFVIDGTRIKKCIHFFESSQFMPQHNRQKEIIDKCCGICKRNSKIFLGIIVVGLALFAAKPSVTGRKQKLPVDIWLSFDPVTDPIVFVCIYVFIMLATAQIAVLKDNIQNLNQYAEEVNKRKYVEKSSETAKKLVVHEIIRKFVDQHNATLKFTDEYEECFSLPVFSQLMGSSLVICFICLQLNKVDPVSFDFIALATFLIVGLLQIYLYCCYDTMLFEESNSITDAIYMSNWYECDIPLIKSLIILMERSKKPIIITAGKILELSIDTFSTILRRSYSLLAVLKNV